MNPTSTHWFRVVGIPLTIFGNLSLTLGSDANEHIIMDLANFAHSTLEKWFCFRCLIFHADFTHVE